jgi:hypothetical protein
VLEVPVIFSIETEQHDRREFQEAGHFVPGMTDSEGRRREWKGPDLFVGTLWHEHRDENGNLTHRVQVLRVLADSQAELVRLMVQNIRDDFFARFTAQQQQVQAGFYDKLLRSQDEHNEFVAWLQKNNLLKEGECVGLSTAALAREVIQRNI